MAKGINTVGLSGNVASDVLYATTGKGDPACSFRLAAEKAYKATVFVRINVYGGNVDVVRKRFLKKGDYVVVEGELMNRRGRNQADLLTEIRCDTIVIPVQGARRDHGYGKEDEEESIS